MDWRARRGSASRQTPTQNPQNSDGRDEPDNIADIANTFGEYTRGPTEDMPMVEEGWLLGPNRIIPEQPVMAELMRVLPELNRHAWPKEVRVRLLERLHPGDRIVKVDHDFLLVAARPPRECYRVWRCDA
jgi:hypothetical protein